MRWIKIPDGFLGGHGGADAARSGPRQGICATPEFPSGPEGCGGSRGRIFRRDGTPRAGASLPARSEREKFLSVAATFRPRGRPLYRRQDGHIGQPSGHQATVNQAKFLRGERMTLAIGDTAPDFEANTTEGRIRFHDWIGNSWAVLFSHPKDFTPICTTELGYMAKIKPEFDKRGVKIIGLSVDPVENHAKWADDIKETQGTAPNYPMIGDTDLSIAKAWGMLPAAASGDVAKRTAADNATVRNVFVVGPDKKIKLILVYPMTTGRNFDEVLRVIDSLQLTAKHKVATPVNWKQGEDVVIAGSVSDEDAKKQYPAGWKAPRPYLRIVPQPK
jgi:alkyl hydroperoxide reductase subunit AhpC